MKTEYIPKVTTLLAGAIVCMVSIIKNMDVTYSLEVLLATLVIFYIIGIIAQKIIVKVENSNRFMQQQREEALQAAANETEEMTEENTESQDDAEIESEREVE